MKKALLVNAVIVSLLFFLGMPVRTADAAMPLPSGSGNYQYSSIENPVLSDDPSLAQPVSVGSVAVGGETLSMRINLHEISGAVDLYFGLYLPILDPVNIYLLDTNNAFGTLAQGLVPFRQNVEGVIDEAIFGDLPVQGLPKGTYQIYLVVTPAGSLESYYFWQTSFFVGGWSITEVEAPIISAFGEDGGFDAVLFALNKGYSLEQIVEGSVTNRLQANGDVFQYGSSSVEAPHYPPLDLLTDTAPATMTEQQIKGTLSKGTLSKDVIKENLTKATKGQISLLGLLLVGSTTCVNWDDPKACFAKIFVYLIEVTTPDDCTTNCVPCLKFSDGTTKCPPEKGVIDLTKSFSGLGVTVTRSASSLKVNKTGIWTANTTNGTGPFTYYFYWGADGSYTQTPSNSASHTYSASGTYNVVVRVEESGSGNDALSSALPVEVKDANGGGCGVITGWTQADAEAILSPLEDWGVNGPYSDPDYATLVLSGIWTVREDYKWRRSVLVFSFADAAAAQAKFDEINAGNKALDTRSIIIDDLPTLFSIVLGYQRAAGDAATGFRLTELYRETFVIYISGWSLVFNDYEGILMTTLRGNFLSLAGRAHGIIDEKCGF